MTKMDRERKEIRLMDIVFDETIYPRKEHIPSKVQQYARDIAQIEQRGDFISISIDNKLLDGKHRYLAYRKVYENAPETKIPVFVYPVTEEKEQYALALELNSTHGMQLSEEEKNQGAKQLYSYGYPQKTIAQKLSVSTTTVSRWLSRTIKEEKEKQKQKVYDLWLSCHTQEEIEKIVNIPHRTASDWIDSFGENPTMKFSPKHAFEDENFKPPIYNVWKVQNKSNKVNHFGNTEERWLENLLYLYTNPFDIVVDPFAGGGSTIDVCKKRGRRYWVGDRKPIVERETEIRLHDIVTDGFPDLKGRWKDVRLVYLDPPYWKQSEGKYSNDPTDLANMPLEDFTTTLAKIIEGFAKKLSDAYIALIIQPTQWNAPEKRYTDHIADMLRLIKLPLDMRYSVPYESQQYNAQMVEWAKSNRKTLVLTREIIVWRVN